MDSFRLDFPRIRLISSVLCTTTESGPNDTRMPKRASGQFHWLATFGSIWPNFILPIGRLPVGNPVVTLLRPGPAGLSPYLRAMTVVPFQTFREFHLCPDFGRYFGSICGARLGNSRCPSSYANCARTENGWFRSVYSNVIDEVSAGCRDILYLTINVAEEIYREWNRKSYMTTLCF